MIVVNPVATPNPSVGERGTGGGQDGILEEGPATIKVGSDLTKIGSELTKTAAN